MKHTIIENRNKQALGDLPIGTFFEYDNATEQVGVIFVKIANAQGNSLFVSCFSLKANKIITSYQGNKVVPLRVEEITLSVDNTNYKASWEEASLNAV